MTKPRKLTPTNDKTPIRKLLEIMDQLRDPDEGCPWDNTQTFKSLTSYTIEEAYEVTDAVKRGNIADLQEELGDLLLQIIFYTQIAKEKNYFNFDDVVTSISNKMVRRHPNVFGNTAKKHERSQNDNWETQKDAERSVKAQKKGEHPSALDGVAGTLPALIRALKLQTRAARVGFDWPDVPRVVDKLQEEFQELQIEIENQDKNKIKDEIGDLLFTTVNLARHLEIDPEDALYFGNEKFERRFRCLEKYLAVRGQEPSELPIDDLELAWNDIKSEEFS